MKIKYRQNINALRAAAVIGVAIFHASETWLPDGFVGVDVFLRYQGS